MADQKNPERTELTVSDHDAKRRRFLRAGAAASPAVLSLASQPALGVNCFTPSRSLSRNTSVSQQGKYGECLRAESPGNYKAQQDPNAGAYHWPASVPPSTLFHSVFTAQGSRTGTIFIKPNPSGVGHISMTMGEVLDLTGNADPGKVAFHLIGAYLNAKGGNGAVINLGTLGPGETVESIIIGVWSEWVSKGYYEPMAGMQWGSEQIVNYLKTNGIVA